MTKNDVIRAWKDEDFRERLSEQERAALPDHPAGLTELTANELALANGGEISDNGGPMCGNSMVCTAWGTCNDPRPGGGTGPCY